MLCVNEFLSHFKEIQEVTDDEYALFLDFKFKYLTYVYTSVTFFFMYSQYDFLNDFEWSATTPSHIM